MNEQSAIAALLAQRREQAETSVRKFVRNNSIEELANVIARYAEDSQGSDATKVLDGILAAYGLLVAISDVYGDGGPMSMEAK